jgi:hypothetical protein
MNRPGAKTAPGKHKPVDILRNCLHTQEEHWTDILGLLCYTLNSTRAFQFISVGYIENKTHLSVLKGFGTNFVAAYTGRRSLEQKKGLNTNIQSTGQQIMDSEQEKIHDATHVLDTYTYSPDPFAVSLYLSISVSVSFGSKPVSILSFFSSLGTENGSSDLREFFSLHGIPPPPHFVENVL